MIWYPGPLLFCLPSSIVCLLSSVFCYFNGWAAWSKQKGILSLRNPHDKPAKITLDIGKVFELPAGAPQKYSLKSPWKEDADRTAIVLSAGKEYTFELKPFEVLVFDATPL